MSRAITATRSGGTVVLRAGSYNEAVTVDKTVTIQNYPGEEAWLEGSTPVVGWVADGGRWRHDGWTTRFDHSPTYTQGAADSTSADWQFVNPKAPMAAHPDQLWIAGVPQKQVKSLALLTADTFYLDETSSQLYLGSDPAGQQVRASNIAKAMNIRAANVVLRGFGIRRYAPSVFHVGAITLEKPGAVVENVVVSEMATTGISVLASGVQLRKVTVEWSGMLGIHGRYADGLVMSNVLSRHNNSEHFNFAPVAGGGKIGTSRGVTVTDSSFVDNFGRGLWTDLSSYNVVVRGSNFTANTGDGLFLEVSARAVIGDSLFSGNAQDGLKVNNTSDVKIWNNTFVGNGRPLNLVMDSRRNTNRNDINVDPRMPWPDPEMPWQLDSVAVSNNVIGPPKSGNCLICVEDYSHKESAESMKITYAGNAFNRTSKTSPTWLAVWSRGAGNPAVFNTLVAFTSATSQEKRGREYTGTAVVDDAGVLVASVKTEASSTALPLPKDVAALIGRPAGSTTLGAWVDGADTTPVPSQTTSPVPTPTAPPAMSPTSSPVVARDGFSRTVKGGWGNAETGGSWTTPWDPGQFNVDDGIANVRMNPGQGLQARLDGVSTARADLQIAFSIDQRSAGAGHWIETVGRRVDDADYRAKVRIGADESLAVWLVRSNGGGYTALANETVPGLTFTPGHAYRIRLQVTGTGSTTLRVKVWDASADEPDWLLTATDNAPELQEPGSVALFTYTAGSESQTAVVASFDELSVG